MEESLIATVVAGVLIGIGTAFRRWRKRRREARAAKVLAAIGDAAACCSVCGSTRIEYSVDEDGASMTQCYKCGALFVLEPE